MNTHGHHFVADHAGMPQLEGAFIDLGYPLSSLKAFYMGNWFTDVQQGVDPVAYANAVPMLKSMVQPIIGYQAWDRVEQALHALLDPPSLDGRSDSKSNAPPWDEDNPLRRPCDEELLRQLDSRHDQAVNEKSEKARDLDAARKDLRQILNRRDEINRELAKTGKDALSEQDRERRERELAVNTIELQQLRQDARGKLDTPVDYKTKGDVEPDVEERFRVRASELGLIIRRLMFVKGFFSFACPFDPESLDAEVYEYVFDNCFTQYYPHEHMDRPEREFYTRESLSPEELEKKDTPQWDDVEIFARDVGNGTRSPNRPQELDPDLYVFLRDDIEIAAGLLAEIDYKWAHKYLREAAPEKPDEKDKEFHFWLARLGYALHPIEDYFAHTTFAERAAATFSDQKQLYDEWVPPGEDATLLKKRQRRVRTKNEATAKRWEKHDPPGWENADEEQHVVSGFFDFRDTVVSLSHIGEHAFLSKFGTAKHLEDDLYGKDRTPEQRELEKEYRIPLLDVFGINVNVPDAVVELIEEELGDVPWVREALQNLEVREDHEEHEKQDKCTYQFKRMTTHLLDLLNDRQAAMNDEENDLARGMFADAKGPLDPEAAARKVTQEHPLFGNPDRLGLLPKDMHKVASKGVPPRVKEEYIRFITVMGTELVPRSGITPYRIFRWIEYMLANPAGRLISFIAGLLGVREHVEKMTKGVAELFYNVVAASRLGCHSLIAKDHGPDGLLYKQQRNCALAVHWYVVRVLLRRLKPLPVHVCREPHDASARDRQKGTINEYIWIDWLELLEFYLRNPSIKKAGALEPREILRDYVVQPGDSLATLEDKFRPEALDPGSFSWRKIARASFNGKDRPRDINRFLKTKKFVDKNGKLMPYGVLAGDGLNYKFTVGAPIKIPVRWDPPAMDPTDKDRAWYRCIMRDWQAIHDDWGPYPYTPDMDFIHHVPIYIKLDEVKQLIDRANAMRNDASEAYMPSKTEKEKDAAEEARQEQRAPQNTLERGQLLEGKGRREAKDNPYVCTHYVQEVLELSNYNVDAAVRDAIHMPMPKDEIASAVQNGEDRIKGAARAIAEFGLGRYVGLDQLQAGDFIQYWTGGDKQVECHCGQVVRVGPEPMTVQLHGCHRSTGIVNTIEVPLGNFPRVYAARPKGNE